MADQRADQEIGAVLIAVNSYRNDPKHCLPYTDGVLKGYIETFYQYLFFQVDVLLDFSSKQFTDALKKFIIRCQKDKMTRIAVVLYGHGGIVNEKECILTNNSELLPIATLEGALHSHFPEGNKYLFIDACRNSALPRSSYVFQTTTFRTTIVRSTLVFEKAICNVWSKSFAMHLRNQCVLSDVVKNVDLDMHRRGFDQNSEIKEQGAADSPDFQGEARACNGHNKMCFRQPNAELQTFIEETEKSFAAMRTNSTHPDPPPVKTLPSSTSSTKTMAGKTATSTGSKYFNSRSFMKRYPKFSEKVQAKPIAQSLKDAWMISTKLCHDIKQTDEEEAGQLLYSELLNFGTPDQIKQVCEAMRDKKGYVDMNQLGRDMLADQDLYLPCQSN